MLVEEGLLTKLLAFALHETYQIIGKEYRHFDEREVVDEIFKDLTN